MVMNKHFVHVNKIQAFATSLHLWLVEACPFAFLARIFLPSLMSSFCLHLHASHPSSTLCSHAPCPSSSHPSCTHVVPLSCGTPILLTWDSHCFSLTQLNVSGLQWQPELPGLPSISSTVPWCCSLWLHCLAKAIFIITWGLSACKIKSEIFWNKMFWIDENLNCWPFCSHTKYIWRKKGETFEGENHCQPL